MQVLLLSDDAEFESHLPALALFAEVVNRAPLTDRLVDGCRSANVVIIDARVDLPAARDACRRLATTAPAVAVMAVVAATDLVAVDVDWRFDDLVLPDAGNAELHGRLRLAIARRRNTLEAAVKFNELVLCPASYTATLRGRRLELTLTEFKLLNCLVQQAGRAFTRYRLMHEVWGHECSRRTIDVHVQRLRAKLGADEWMVETVWGVGYMAASPPVLSGVRAS